MEQQTHQAFGELVETIAVLRGPQGCPWDQEQTHESIARSMIEEAYEAVDAIERGDAADLREELGDVLLQVVLHSQFAADAGNFTIDEVCRSINTKMIRRHPHVFGEKSAQTADDVGVIWEETKRAEREAGQDHVDLLDSIPKDLPSLMQLQKIVKKLEGAQSSSRSEAEIHAALDFALVQLHAQAGTQTRSFSSSNEQSMEDSFGAVYHALAELAIKYHIDTEGLVREKCTDLRASSSGI